MLYCGSEGLDVASIVRGLVSPNRDLPAWDQFAERTLVPTFLGRVAVWQLCEIWRLGAGDEILMPSYNGGTEIYPFLLHGCTVVLYRVDAKARIDVPDIMRRRTPRTKVVYVTHYFGWPQDLHDLQAWCRAEGLHLVEDCALALFSSAESGPLGRVGDAAIFSLGKFLPLPASGVLSLSHSAAGDAHRLRQWPRKESVRRTAQMLRKDLQRFSERCGLYPSLRRLKMRAASRRGKPTPAEYPPDLPEDYYFDRRLKDQTMPPWSLSILHRIESTKVCEQRRTNYCALERGLSEIRDVQPLFDSLPGGTCPLAFPAITSNRRPLVQALDARGICCYPFWDGYHRALDWAEFPEARHLKDNLLTLPVNQSLKPAHMEFILQTLAGLTGERMLAS